LHQGLSENPEIKESATNLVRRKERKMREKKRREKEKRNKDCHG
jgi:hypothetical protein